MQQLSPANATTTYVRINTTSVSYVTLVVGILRQACLEIPVRGEEIRLRLIIGRRGLMLLTRPYNRPITWMPQHDEEGA
jgi:hypothetical protein